MTITRAALAAVLILPIAITRADDTPAKPATATTKPDVPAAVPEGREGRIQFMIQRDRSLVDNLKLNDDQKKQVDAIYADATKKVQAAMNEPRNGDGRPFQRFRQIINDTHGQITAILNDDQRAAYEDGLSKMREQFRQRMAAGGGGFGQNGNFLAPPSGTAMVDRLRIGVTKLDLTDDQKAKVKGVIDDLDKNIKPLKDEFGNIPDANKDKARDIFADAREKLQAILTPDQQTKLRSYIQQQQPPQNDDAKPQQRSSRKNRMDERMAGDDATQKMTASTEKMSASTEKMSSDDALPRFAAKPRSAIAELPRMPLITAGQTAPEFTLKQLDGSMATLSSYKDKVTVLIFGSYTTPTFRDRAAAISDLAQTYDAKANFLVIYTKESHPTGGWEIDRNKDEKVKIEEPKTESDKIALARKAKEILKLNVPFAVDTDGDTTATAYGAFPNGAVILAKDGTVAYAQHWCDPTTLRRHIDEALSAKLVAVGK